MEKPLSIASITQSEISQVDLKLKSNYTKKKLKQLLKSCDKDKSNFVAQDVFFELLDLHKINLDKDAVNYLKKQFGKANQINYKEAVNILAIDLKAAGDESQCKWSLLHLLKDQYTTIGDDSISQVGGQSNNGKRSVFDNQPSNGQFLNKQKLETLENLSENKNEVRSQISKIESIAKSRFSNNLKSIPEEKSEGGQSKNGMASLKSYLLLLYKNEPENFERLAQILIIVSNNFIEQFKFLRIKVAVSDFLEQKGRRMSMEELIEFCKLEFDDFKLIDFIVQFCKETAHPDTLTTDKPAHPDINIDYSAKEQARKAQNKLENIYTIYVDSKKVVYLNELVSKFIPILKSQNKQVSRSSLIQAININESDKFKQRNHDEISQTNNAPQKQAQLQAKSDPHLQKLLEIIYANVKDRFQMFANSFRYLDFKNRNCVSFSDFSKGLVSFGIRLGIQDRKYAFAYLADCVNDLNQIQEETPLMNYQQYQKLQNEAKERNVDPFEMQIFQEHLSATLKEMQKEEAALTYKNDLADFLSQAPSAAYQGLGKKKKVAKFKRDTNSLPRFIEENKYKVEFGMSTLPSDSMNMVMTNEFGNDFIRKMLHKQLIEKELEEIANQNSKNFKHNVYLTKSQALRNQKTLGELERVKAQEEEDYYHQRLHQPKLFNSNKRLQIDSSSPRPNTTKVQNENDGELNDLQDNSSKKALPPLKRKINAQEKEILQLLNQNLLQTKMKRGNSYNQSGKNLANQLLQLKENKPNIQQKIQEKKEEINDIAGKIKINDEVTLMPTLPQSQDPRTVQQVQRATNSNLKQEFDQGSMESRKIKNDMLNEFFKNKRKMA